MWQNISESGCMARRMTTKLFPKKWSSIEFFKRMKSPANACIFFSSRRRHTRLQGDWSSDVCLPISRFLKVDPARCLKTLIVEGRGEQVVALVLRGDHELNAVKAQRLEGVASPLRMASAQRALEATGAEPGYVGLVGLKCRVYADHSALALADFVCGANEKDMHLTGVNWERDVGGAIPADLRNVVEGDPSPTGAGRLKIARGIEVGHIFQLGRKYSEPMKALVLDEAGRETALYMGCYGIGVTRIVAAAIEQNHDERGIIWPAPIAPFQVVLVSLNLQKSARVREVSDRLYAERSEEHTSELQSPCNLVCRLLLEKKKQKTSIN